MDSSIDVLEAFKQSDAYKTALAQAEQQRLAKRKQLAERLARLAIEGPEAARPLQKAEAEARERVAAAEAALAAAKEQLTVAANAYMARSNALSSEREALKRELGESASREIFAFASEMENLWERERHVVPSVNHEPTGTFDVASPTMRPIIKTTSNYPQKLARLEALRRASTVALEELVYLALSDEELAARLKQLRDGLPARFGD